MIYYAHPVHNLGIDVVGDKLVYEGGILAPEAPDVRDLIEHHGQPLHSDAKGPSNLVLHASPMDQLLFHDSAAGDLDPLVQVLEEDLQLPGGMREREEVVRPTILDVCKKQKC
jgi:hypothetical protein